MQVTEALLIESTPFAAGVIAYSRDDADRDFFIAVYGAAIVLLTVLSWLTEHGFIFALSPDFVPALPG